MFLTATLVYKTVHNLFFIIIHMKKLLITTSFIIATIIGVQANAHHSFSATFTEDIITVEGVVENFRFANPHVLVTFSVTDDNGEITEWVSEGASATSKRRDGWGTDTIKAGDFVKITGNSTRNGSPMVSMEDIKFVDAATRQVIGEPGSDSVAEVNEGPTTIPLTFANGIPNLTAAWGRVFNNRGAANAPITPEVSNGGMGDGMGPPDGGMGMGAMEGPPPDNITVGTRRPPSPASPGGIAEEPAYTEAAAALQASYDPINDPQVQCEPPGLVRQAHYTPHPVRIEQHADHVVLSYEEYGGVRTIYFDDRDIVGGDKTHLGQSTARYEGQKLIIESNNLKANLSGASGYALSDQLTTVETYYRLEDDNGRSVLRLDADIYDPGHLTEPWKMSWIKSHLGNYEFIPVECEKPL